jgi:predicted site-specific integrase-resolvase
MQLILYKEAASLLGVSVGTLKHAVSRGELTKAGLLGNRQQLIKEQVMLFVGTNGKKKDMSYNLLSSEEKALWHKYADSLNTANSTSHADIERIVDEKLSAFARVRMAQIEKDENRIREEKEALRPFLQRELLMA